MSLSLSLSLSPPLSLFLSISLSHSLSPSPLLLRRALTIRSLTYMSKLIYLTWSLLFAVLHLVFTLSLSHFLFHFTAAPPSALGILPNAPSLTSLSMSTSPPLSSFSAPDLSFRVPLSQMSTVSSLAVWNSLPLKGLRFSSLVQHRSSAGTSLRVP